MSGQGELWEAGGPMEDAVLEELLVRFILFVILPAWGVFGTLDWYVHTKVPFETTTGLKEALFHVVMGFMVMVPIILGLFFEFNVLAFIVTIVLVVAHEFMATWDVEYAQDLRPVSPFEQWIHSYLAALPVFLLALVSILRWETFKDLIFLRWDGQLAFVVRDAPLGGSRYYLGFFVLMFFLIVIPFVNETYRCWMVERPLAKYRRTPLPEREPAPAD
jgi:hypothetical protein